MSTHEKNKKTESGSPCVKIWACSVLCGYISGSWSPMRIYISNTLPETNIFAPWKWMVKLTAKAPENGWDWNTFSFPFGAFRPIFRGKLAFSFREGAKKHHYILEKKRLEPKNWWFGFGVPSILRTSKLTIPTHHHNLLATTEGSRSLNHQIACSLKFEDIPVIKTTIPGRKNTQGRKTPKTG